MIQQTTLLAMPNLSHPFISHPPISFYSLAQQFPHLLTFQPNQAPQSQIHYQTILKEIADCMQKQYEQEINCLMKKTEEEYQGAKQQLENEAKKLKKQKASPLQKQIGKLKRLNTKQESEKYEQLQNQYLSGIFESSILFNPRITQLEQKLAQQIRQQCKIEYEQEKQRRKRQFLVKIQNRNKREKEKFDAQIKKRIHIQKGLTQKNKQLQQMKILLASSKSKLNLKLYDLNEEIKRMTNQIKDKEYILMGQSLKELKDELQKLRKQKACKRNIQKHQTDQNKNNDNHSEGELSFEEDSLQINIVYPHSNRELGHQRKMANLSTQEDSKNVVCPQEQFTIREKAFENMKIYDCFQDSLQYQSHFSGQKNQGTHFKELTDIRSILRFYQSPIMSSLGNLGTEANKDQIYLSERNYDKQRTNRQIRGLAPLKAKHLSINTRRTIIKNLALLADDL